MLPDETIRNKLASGGRIAPTFFRSGKDFETLDHVRGEYLTAKLTRSNRYPYAYYWRRNSRLETENLQLRADIFAFKIQLKRDPTIRSGMRIMRRKKQYYYDSIPYIKFGMTASTRSSVNKIYKYKSGNGSKMACNGN